MSHAEVVLAGVLDEVAVKENIKNCKVKIEPITSGGANYTSALFLATLSGDEDDDLELFAKVAIVNKDFRPIIHADFLFETEAFVYNELTTIFDSIQNKYKLSGEHRYRFPKHYAIHTKHLEETVVLENLTKQGFVTFNRFQSVDWEYASKAVEALAKFHALSYAFEREDPERFEIVYAQQKMDMPDFSQEAVKSMSKAALSVVNEEIKDKLEKFIEDNCQMDVFHTKYYAPYKKRLLVYADYRPNNIMHRREQNGNKIDSLIPVDYQTIRQGSAVTDLMYFIFSGSDEEFRKEHYENLVELYYTVLCRQLKKMSMDPEEVYSRADYDDELQYMLPFGLLMGIFLLPIVTVEAENAPRMDSETANIDEFSVKANDLYSSRFNGIVNDYVRWGLL